jgi:hypothetical protein
MFPPPVGLAVARVPRTPLRLRTHLTGSPANRGLDMWASSPQRGLGGEVSRWWWSCPCHRWCLIRPLPSSAGPNQARRSILPSPSEVMWNSSTESPIMARSGDGGPPRAEPITIESEPSPMGERLRPPKRSVMNSRLPKQIVSPREKPPHDRWSQTAASASTDDGTIGTPRGKARYKSPFLAPTASAFCTDKIGWLRSHVTVLRWSCELRSTL